MVACCVLYAHEILGGKSYIFPFQKANEAAVVVAILREHGVMSVWELKYKTFTGRPRILEVRDSCTTHSPLQHADGQ